MAQSIIRTVVDYLKSIFLNGLLVILPITLTFVVFRFFFRLLKGWLAPIYRIEPTIFHKIPQSEILIVLLFILLVGIIFKSFFLQSFLQLIEDLFAKIPLINQVYYGIKQIVHAFTRQDKLSFQKVVVVEFPREGMYSIGFLTSEVPAAIAPEPDKKFFKIFIPTTPNPTTGFLISATEDDFKTVDLSKQEAMTLIMSGGIVQPERYSRR